jgi:flagellar motor protein MotB
MDDPDHNPFAHPNHEEAEEGEPWLVSYADMMTLLFGFFVLMYSFAAAKVDETSDEWVKVKREVSAYFGSGGQDETDREQKATTQAGPSDQSSQNKGREASSDVPAVPFDSKFRFLATRDEISDEVASLLASLAERSDAEPGSLEKLRGQVEVDVLRGMLLRIGAGVEGKSAVNEGEQDEAGTATKPITVVTDRRRILSGDEARWILSADGVEFIRQLAAQLVAFRRPLDVMVEAHVGQPGAAQSAHDMTQSFAVSAQRASFLMNALFQEVSRLSKGAKDVDHIFRSSAMGRFSGSPRVSGAIVDPIVFRIAIIER